MVAVNITVDLEGGRWNDFNLLSKTNPIGICKVPEVQILTYSTIYKFYFLKEAATLSHIRGASRNLHI